MVEQSVDSHRHTHPFLYSVFLSGYAGSFEDRVHRGRGPSLWAALRRLWAVLRPRCGQPGVTGALSVPSRRRDLRARLPVIRALGQQCPGGARR